jgi:hypothetical protein
MSPADLAILVDDVNAFMPRALELARRYDLTLRAPATPKLVNDDWTMVLRLEGDHPEYRIGFSVAVSKTFKDPDKVNIWTCVTDLSTGTWKQHNSQVPVDLAQLAIAECLTFFEDALFANEGIDPYEMAKKHAGTKYYWEFENDDGFMTWTSDTVGATGTVEGSDGEFEGNLHADDGELLFSTNGKTSKSLIKKLEKAYDKLVTAGIIVATT